MLKHSIIITRQTELKKHNDARAMANDDTVSDKMPPLTPMIERTPAKETEWKIGATNVAVTPKKDDVLTKRQMELMAEAMVPYLRSMATDAMQIENNYLRNKVKLQEKTIRDSKWKLFGIRHEMEKLDDMLVYYDEAVHMSPNKAYTPALQSSHEKAEMMKPE